MFHNPISMKAGIVTKLVCITILISLILIQNSIITAGEQCDECPNPLVEVKPVIFAGNIPDFESWGWHFSGGGVQEGTTDYLYRSQHGYIDVKKNSPCADFYFIFDDVATTERYGVQTGDAKYKIDTIVEFLDVEEGQKSLVQHITQEWVKLDKPFYESGKLVNYDLVTISDELELIPLLGQVDVTHELVCLKNKQMYVLNSILKDWINDPPGVEDDDGVNEVGEESHFYSMPEGTLVVDGELYVAPDSHIQGNFSPSDFSATPIWFEEGDVGEIIRKKETPTRFSMNIDQKSEYPPYYLLNISNIKNQFDEIMPNNIKIALKVDEGRLEEGEMLDGWHVYETSGGRVTDKIFYRPPQCAIAKEDILHVARVCDYSANPATVGKEQFTKKIVNPLCFDAVLTMTSSSQVQKTINQSKIVGNDQIDKNWDFVDNKSATITLQLEKHSEIDQFYFGEYWVYYMSKSRNLDNHNIEWHDHRYEHKQSQTSDFGMEQTIHYDANISDVRIQTPDVPMMVIVCFDKKSKKAKRMILQASLVVGYKYMENYNSKTDLWGGGKSETRQDSDVKTSNKKYSLKVVGKEVMDPTLKRKFPSGCLVSGGDGESTFSGSGREEGFDGHCPPWEDCSEVKTFKWTLTVNKK